MLSAIAQNCFAGDGLGAADVARLVTVTVAPENRPMVESNAVPPSDEDLVTLALALLEVRVPVLGCKGCGLRYVSWRRDEAADDQYAAPPGGSFDVNGKPAYGRANVLTFAYDKVALPLHLEGLFGDLRGRSVYEFGCAEGVMASLLSDFGAEVSGSDLDQPKVHYASNILGVPGLSDDGDYVWNMAERSLDCVYAFHTVEHVLEPDKFFDRFVRSLKPGGSLVVSVPHTAIRESGEIVDLGGDHLVGYSQPILEGFFRRHGLEIVDCQVDVGRKPADRPDPIRGLPVWSARSGDITMVGRRAA